MGVLNQLGIVIAISEEIEKSEFINYMGWCNTVCPIFMWYIIFINSYSIANNAPLLY